MRIVDGKEWLLFNILEHGQPVRKTLAILRQTEDDSFVVFTKGGSMLVKPIEYFILSEREYFEQKPKVESNKFY